jgi:hypothetical protein
VTGQNSPGNVLHGNATKNWTSAQEKDKSQCIFDFKNRKFTLTAYMIQREKVDWKGWKVEGSMDNAQWHLLDARQDDPTMTAQGENQCYIFGVTHTQTQPFRYFQIRCEQKNSANTDALVSRAMDFYGTLI